MSHRKPREPLLAAAPLRPSYPPFFLNWQAAFPEDLADATKTVRVKVPPGGKPGERVAFRLPGHSEALEMVVPKHARVGQLVPVKVT